MNGGSNGGSKKVEPPETLIFQGVPLVEVAGFPSGPQAQSSREALLCLPLVSLDSFAFLPPAADSTLCCRSARSPTALQAACSDPRPFNDSKRASHEGMPFCCRSGGIRIRSELWHPVQIYKIWCNLVSITDRFHDIQYN